MVSPFSMNWNMHVEVNWFHSSRPAKDSLLSNPWAHQNPFGLCRDAKFQKLEGPTMCFSPYSCECNPQHYMGSGMILCWFARNEANRPYSLHFSLAYIPASLFVCMVIYHYPKLMIFSMNKVMILIMTITMKIELGVLFVGHVHYYMDK